MIKPLLCFLLLLVLIHPSSALCAGGLLDFDEQNLEEKSSDELAEDFLYEDEEEVAVFDPIQPINRGIFWFNDKLYFYLLKPVAKAYRVVPERARVSVSNVFSNVRTPIRLCNSAFQLKFKDAGTEFVRFLMNTTVGIGGLFDPAKKYAGLERKNEDFGQTLGRYRVGPGFYLVLPLFGPSNLRDTLAGTVDAYLDPVNYLNVSYGEFVAIKAYETVNTVSLDKDTYESIKKEALDPYLFVRDAYAQKREGEIKK